MFERAASRGGELDRQASLACAARARESEQPHLGSSKHLRQLRQLAVAADERRRPRRQVVRTIGQALLTQHRVSGRIEVEEKPDVLWDHPQFERLYARLADEYELKERAAALSRKLRIISETTSALTDLIDTGRSLRLEATIVALIVVEVIILLYELFLRAPR